MKVILIRTNPDLSLTVSEAEAIVEADPKVQLLDSSSIGLLVKGKKADILNILKQLNENRKGWIWERLKTVRPCEDVDE